MKLSPNLIKFREAINSFTHKVPTLPENKRRLCIALLNASLHSKHHLRLAKVIHSSPGIHEYFLKNYAALHSSEIKALAVGDENVDKRLKRLKKAVNLTRKFEDVPHLNFEIALRNATTLQDKHTIIASEVLSTLQVSPRISEAIKALDFQKGETWWELHGVLDRYNNRVHLSGKRILGRVLLRVNSIERRSKKSQLKNNIAALANYKEEITRVINAYAPHYRTGNYSSVPSSVDAANFLKQSLPKPAKSKTNRVKPKKTKSNLKASELSEQEKYIQHLLDFMPNSRELEARKRFLVNGLNALHSGNEHTFPTLVRQTSDEHVKKTGLFVRQFAHLALGKIKIPSKETLELHRKVMRYF